jgi:hypothetical protein
MLDFARGVHVAGTHAYVANGYSGLQVTDISNPENPGIVGSCTTPGYAHGVYIAGTYAYVADDWLGLQVIDISDPENGYNVGACNTPGSAFGLHVTGTYAYVADGGAGLQVIDISNPENPHIAGACDTPGSAYGVYVSGSYAYVADGASGLQIIDISDPENPSVVGSCDIPDSAFGVHVTGTYACVAAWKSGLQVIDISDPASPTIVGSCDADSARGIYVTGTYAYMASYSSLQVIDIRDPENLCIVGSCNTPGLAYDVYVTDTYAYVADGGAGLRVVEKCSPLTDIQYMDSGTLIATVPPGYRPGTYYLHVTNPDGGHAILKNAFTAFEVEVEVTMKLPAGWSMVSLPVTPRLATLGTLFPEAMVVYKYEKGMGYVRVEAGESLEVGAGYWILLDIPQSFVIKGAGITEYTTPVENGWYMIGGCSLPAQKIVTSGKIDVIYGYAQGIGYTRLLGSELLKLGKGYWILFSNTSEGAEFTASTSASK